MGSTPKRWVLKPLMPKLEKSDLRAMLSPGSESPQSPDISWSRGRDGDSPTFSFDNISVTRIHSSVTVSVPNGEDAKDVVVLARQVAVSEEGSTTEDGPPSYPSSPGTPSSTDSHVGFYSFVEDPKSPEAEKNEAYMVSPERQAKLSTLKQKSSFKLQTYVEERRPEKLFEESNGDSHYKVEDASAEDSDEEKPDRTEIIRSQAPKKNPVFKEQWSSLENLDVSKNPYSLVEGFSLCYSPVSTKSPQTEVEPGTIDNQQIDFNTARKQFLMMEKSKENPFRYSPQQMPQFSKPWARSFSAEADLFTKDVSKNKSSKDESSQKRQENETKKTVTVYEDPDDRMQGTLIDDLDSGIGDRSAGCTNDEILPSVSEMWNSSTVTSISETPIEREIRIAREREEDLRRSRGIFREDTSEMVEIKTKPILSQPSSQLKPIKAKETNRVSFLIQREMDRMNRNQGLHDRETPSDLDERRKTSGSHESYEEPIRAVTVEDPWIAASPVLVEQRDVPDSQETLSPCCPHRHKDEAMIQKGPTEEFQGRTVRTSFYVNEGATDTQNSDIGIANRPAWTAAYKVKESEKTTSPVNSPSSPLEPVRSSRSIAARRSYWEGSGEWPRLQNASDIIRKEIEEDLRREQELQELRETSNLSLTTDRGIPEPTSSEPIPGQNDVEQTSLNSSQENLVEVDAVLPERSTQKPTYNLSYSWSGDSAATRISLAGPTSRLPSMSIVTAQPWGSPKPVSPAVLRAAPTVLASPRPEAFSTSSHKGLTETLLEDFEERRARLKLEESSYAGIQPIDSINNEVVEATRVTRHKNTRALRWEAGVYANEEN